MVAFEKGALGSPSTKIANFTLLDFKIVLFQTNQFRLSTIPMSKTVLYQTIQFSIKAVPFQTIQFSISTQYKCQNNFILSNSVENKYAV